ncbi:hypothetical protein PDJAM_G00257420 [Pangasius djambal]|uniref:Uncharacterized protein n=1 Tax=Pangasius djambal TaxID=1691987 RepID=A0ACC5YL63_9TELE|nr:hypothetical protein [Pangasius djambal]
MTGKGRELADMMERRKVDIQETRWKGSKARSIGAGFKLFYYGVDSKRNGVGVVLKEELGRNVLEVKRVSDRVMSLKLEIEGMMLNVVSGYAPQVGCELEEQERFWSELDEVIESILMGERVVIGADFNGHVGEGNTGDEEVMGKFGVKERNLEGQLIVDFAKRMDMAVVNTYFQKREEHRVTYKSGEMRKLELIDCESYKVVLIFDGLDECRLPLNFQNNERLCDVTESASVDVLLTNFIKGNLLPSALLWITSRPGAANQIPPECVDQVTEVRGFSDPQKEEYFRNRISDQSLAKKIITHMKSSRSLYIMCHIPVFCWISATVLERMLGEAESGEIPKTLTQMFTHFLIFQVKHKDQKYHQKCDPQQTRERILALGKLAFQQLEKGNLIFYEEDLRECGTDVREVSVYSGVCTQIFREEFGLHLGKVFSFVHLSVQEFLAALYAFLCFIFRKTNVVVEQSNGLFNFFRNPNMSDFLRSAVDKALQSENGHLDLFLRFLLGLSLESNQTLLRGLMPQTGSSSHSKQETVKYIKEKIRENPSPEKSINLFHCLNELNDHSLVQEVQTYLNRGGDSRLSGTRLSPAHWSALVFVLLNSEQELDVFDLRKYDPSEECLLRLLPVVKASRKAV